MRGLSRAQGFACAALVLGSLATGCTQAGDPVVTVTLVEDAGTNGAAGQTMQTPVDAGTKPPMTCEDELDSLYSVYSSVVANDCRLDKNDPLVIYLESIRRYAQKNAPDPMPGESRQQSFCDAAGMPFAFYMDEQGRYNLCPAACDSLRIAVRRGAAKKQACEMAKAAAAGSAGIAPPPSP